MIKRLPLSSSELRIILELNQPDVRDVAWNPTPRVICAIDRPRLCLLTDKYIGNESLGRPDDDVFLFFEPLEDIEPNPARMGSADYLDMFKELLEVHVLHSSVSSYSPLVVIRVSPSCINTTQWDSELM